ncbi:MAG: GGDEF-domain containing protein, partial [Actinobacteria bacterium HGW-Actinobacteria-8]
AIAAIVGEVRPVRLPRVDVEERTLSASAPFVLALIAFSSVGLVVLVQAIASVADDVLHRRALAKSLFNTAQYALSVIAGRAVYSWLTDIPFFPEPVRVAPEHIVPLIVAGVAMIGANWVIVSGVVSIVTEQRLWIVLRKDMRDYSVTNVVLLSVGAIAALVSRDGLIALVLLGAPVVAAHLFAVAAARHAHDATHDSLTGLGNRGQLHLRLNHALESASPMGDHGPSLVLLDLDHFKDINDTLGHPVGDQILRHVADRLVVTAPENASVHRLGGDEFAVVIRGGMSDAQQVAADALASFDEPIPVENLELLVRASVGVAVAPLHGSDSETLMKNADIALYHAKIERDRISTYSAEFDVNTVERLQLLSDLRTGLDTRQLHVVYQPQVDLQTGHTVGVEALVRWIHPDRGLVDTGSFILLAENSGLIFPLTAFVLDTALGQLASWRASGYDIRMAVNLSARHLSDLGLPDQVVAAAELHDVPLSALVLEVTETGILSDPIRADIVLRTLRGLGVEISIDDYGTGNASLSYLKRLEIDELKIDRSFVSNIDNDDHDRIIVRSTIELALALGLRVVAEGIEDEPTSVALRTLGDVIGQGYHLGRPALPEVVEATLRLERRANVGEKATGV